jgi:hypothetical protein
MSPRRLLLIALLPLIWSLLVAAPAASAAVAGPVYALDPLSHTLKIKPHRLRFSDSKFTELRWRHWGTDVARARGIHRILTCSPSCGEGGAETTATTLKLSRIREKNGRLRYSCMSWKDDQKVTDLPDHGSLNPFSFRPCRPPGATATASRHCRGIDLGFTTAQVTARRMGCRRARFVVLEWKRKAAAYSRTPRVLKALRFRCHFSGSDELLTLRCTKDDKVAKATWVG